MDEKLTKTVVTVAGLIIVVPIVVRGLVLVGAVGYAAVEGVINQVKFNKKIKKGLKDGSIVEYEGHYYKTEDFENGLLYVVNTFKEA